MGLQCIWGCGRCVGAELQPPPPPAPATGTPAGGVPAQPPAAPGQVKIPPAVPPRTRDGSVTRAQFQTITSLTNGLVTIKRSSLGRAEGQQILEEASSDANEPMKTYPKSAHSRALLIKSLRDPRHIVLQVCGLHECCP